MAGVNWGGGIVCLCVGIELGRYHNFIVWMRVSVATLMDFLEVFLGGF